MLLDILKKVLKVLIVMKKGKILDYEIVNSFVD